MSNPGVRCEALEKRFGATVAVKDAGFEVERGTTLALLGPSGCGKTTLLRLIAGFETPEAGRIEIQGRAVFENGRSVPPEERRIGFVFQDYALFPHLSVAGNIGFGLKGRPGKTNRIEEMLRLVGLEGEGARMPQTLSGGQQQRVALARALAPGPDLLLLDEPFSSLDATLRGQVRLELRRILAATGSTAILVTHDQEEALSLGTRVAVMEAGRILDFGSPSEIYLQPKSRETARIVGSINVLRGEARGETASCVLGLLRILGTPPATGACQILIRPESIRLEARSEALNGSCPFPCATILDLDFHGNHQHVILELDSAERLHVRVDPAEVFQRGQRVHVRAMHPVTALPCAD